MLHETLGIVSEEVSFIRHHMDGGGEERGKGEEAGERYTSD